MKTRVQPRVHNEPAIFRTKEEYVADFLRAAILSGEIARGTRLKQADLAAQLGLSITPVREALKLLAAEGFVHGATHRGALVAPLKSQRLPKSLSCVRCSRPGPPSQCDA
jgi:DNA-binding GntR family transcriptional regulator